MKGADFVWDKEKLDSFIAKLDEVVPGNSMKPYGGLAAIKVRKLAPARADRCGREPNSQGSPS